LPHVQRGDDCRSKDGSGLRDSGLPESGMLLHDTSRNRFPEVAVSGLRALIARPVWLLRSFPITTTDTRARGVMSAYRSSLWFPGRGSVGSFVRHATVSSESKNTDGHQKCLQPSPPALGSDRRASGTGIRGSPGILQHYQLPRSRRNSEVIFFFETVRSMLATSPGHQSPPLLGTKPNSFNRRATWQGRSPSAASSLAFRGV
jgi:hypothetical protein